MEPPVDNMPQTSVNSIITKKWWTNNINLSLEISHWINYWKHSNPNFAKDETSIGTTNLTKMWIDMGNSEPVSQKPYPILMKQYDRVKNKINKVLGAKVIWSSHSDWSAAIITLKGDGGKCLIIDYRAMNKITWKFIWPMPKVENIFSKLNGEQYFSALDLWAGYHHIPLENDLIPKTVFTSPFGKYEYLKVSFGLAKAPAYFQELMNKVLKDLCFTIAYLDDIIIYSKAVEVHLDHLQQFFHRLHNTKFSMKLSKCHFFTNEIQYLGHVLSNNRYKPLPLKMEAIKIMQTPKNVKHVPAFLGLVGYYWKFTKKFARITKPLTTLMHHDAKFDWILDHQAAFVSLKGALIQTPILHYQDPSKRYIVYTGASDNACGAQLSQECNGQELPITFFSHTSTYTQWKMKHSQTRSLWYLLHHNEMELLSTGIWHHSCAMTTNPCRSSSKIRMWTSRRIHQHLQHLPIV